MDQKFKLTLTGIFLLVSGLLVASCGQQKSFVRVANCPAVGVLSHMGELTRFGGAQQTNDNIMFDAVIADLDYICADQDSVVTEVSFSIQAQRGPALNNDVQTLTYFVVVIRDNYMVTAKKKFTTQVRFAPGQTTAGVRETVVQRFADFEIPKKYHYEIFVGFELSPEEFKFNVVR